jgi:hypothetical protein
LVHLEISDEARSGMFLKVLPGRPLPVFLLQFLPGAGRAPGRLSRHHQHGVRSVGDVVQIDPLLLLVIREFRRQPVPVPAKPHFFRRGKGARGFNAFSPTQKRGLAGSPHFLRRRKKGLAERVPKDARHTLATPACVRHLLGSAVFQRCDALIP